MKPKNIFLIRHGESVGNADRSIYAYTPDWKIPLTDKGREQAKEAGKKLLTLQNEYGGWAFYTSPYVRAKQTTEEILSQFPTNTRQFIRVTQDPRLREQEYGNYKDAEEYGKSERERIKFGTFFYRFEQGESGGDVYDRCSGFLETLYRDFEKETCPDNIAIVFHGFTLRVFLTRWFHWDVEHFHRLRNPDNAEIFHMELDKGVNKYNLLSPMRLRDIE